MSKSQTVLVSSKKSNVKKNENKVESEDKMAERMNEIKEKRKDIPYSIKQLWRMCIR